MFKVSPNENESLLLNEIEYTSFFENNKANNNPKFIITQIEPQNSNLGKKKNRELISVSSNEPTSSNGRWSKEEHDKFIEGIIKFGNDWKKVQNYVSTRSSTQARSHAQKFLLKLRNNEYLKKNNIDLSLSWSKVIQLIKKSFPDDIIYKILNETSDHKGKIKKKFAKKKKLIKTDITNINNNNEKEKELDTNNDSEIIFSTTSENSFSFDDKKENSNDFLYYQMENIPQKNSNINYNNKDYIRDFIQNFNKKTLNDSDFNINVSNIYYNNSAILSINSIKKNFSNEKRENLSFSLNEI
jgi:SHAQKYF class myb-like DNA-binding protein